MGPDFSRLSKRIETFEILLIELRSITMWHMSFAPGQCVSFADEVRLLNVRTC